MAKEFFISPTTSYSCSSKAVLTISGESTGIDIEITYPDATTIAQTVTPDSKITLNAGQSITTTNGLISGIEIEKEIDATPLTVQAKIGTLSYSIELSGVKPLIPEYDGNGFVNFANRGFPPNDPVVTTPEEQLAWIQSSNQNSSTVFSNTSFQLNITCSSGNGGSVIVGTKEGFTTSVSYDLINDDIDIRSPNEPDFGGQYFTDFIDNNLSVVNGALTGREITAIITGTGSGYGIASFGVLGEDDTYPPDKVDLSGSYPRIFDVGEYTTRPVMVYYPYMAVYDESLPVELDANGNLDLDFYLTNETDSRSGMRLPKPGFGGTFIPADDIFPARLERKTTKYIGYKHTLNNKIIHHFSFPDTNIYVFSDGSCGVIDSESSIPGAIYIALSGDVNGEDNLWSFKQYLPLLTYYYDPVRAKEYFGNQTFLMDIFTTREDSYGFGLQVPDYDGWNFYSPSDIQVMPLQSVYNRNTRIFDNNVQTPQDVFDKFPEYLQGGVSFTDPGIGLVSIKPLYYLPELTSELFNASPYGEITIEGCAAIEGQRLDESGANLINYKIMLGAGYTSQGKVIIVFYAGPPVRTNHITLDSVFGTGAKAKVHCIGLNKEKTEFILISDNGIVATSTDGTTWTGQDISYLTGGKSIRAIAGDYAVGDGGLILRKDVEGWRRVTLDPIPSNFSRINLTVCEYVTDSHYVIGGTNGFVAVIPI